MGARVQKKWLIKYFNSIKVRLEHYQQSTHVADRTFQFHKGTIRTNLVHHVLAYEPISIP